MVITHENDLKSYDSQGMLICAEILVLARSPVERFFFAFN